MSKSSQQNQRLISRLSISILVAWLSSVQAAAAAESPNPNQSGQSARQEISRPLVMSNPVDSLQLVHKVDYSILNGNTPQQTPAIIQDLSRIHNETRAAEEQADANTTTLSAVSTTTISTTSATNAAIISTQTSATNPVEQVAKTETAISQQFSTPPTSQAPSQPPPPLQTSTPSLQPLPTCSLGDETYQLGERWNPNLPPFGVQVCVLCECTARQRKNCYEAKLTCRRILNECPLIDSCPDGKKPVTVPGQCCKSCQSTGYNSGSNLQPTLAIASSQSPAYESQQQQHQQQQSSPSSSASISFVYMNERSSEHMALINNLPACSVKDSDSTTKPPTPPLVIVANPTTLAPIQTKVAKGIRNDLNGIDSRLAFKSLQDATSNQMKKSRNSHEGTPRQFENPADQHQHPNDVQSATASNRLDPQHSINYDSTGRSSSSEGVVGSRQALASSCKLGNETFQMGDVWNPILPPNGVQVCVQCHCLFKLRKGRACFETYVNCRKINRDCPVIESCPDGNQPINVDGQCCKTCPTSLETSDEQEQPLPPPTGRTSIFQATTMPLNGILRNEKIYKEFHTQTRNYQLCSRLRENSGISTNNKSVKRARRNRRYH